MKQITISIIFCLIAIVSFSQEIADSIEIKQKNGKAYFQHGERLSHDDLRSLLELNEDSYKEFKKAKANLFPVYLFSFAGGFLIGWPLGSALAGNQPQWWMAAGGVALILGSIPFQINYTKHLYKAVTIYNSNLKKIGVSSTVIEVGLSKDKFGLEIRF